MGEVFYDKKFNKDPIPTQPSNCEDELLSPEMHSDWSN